jgi:hypothetical protein
VYESDDLQTSVVNVSVIVYLWVATGCRKGLLYTKVVAGKLY